MTTLNHQNLDLTLYMRSSLLKDSALDTFQRLLRQLVPTWASRLHLYRFRESYPSIDITVDGALQELALGKGLERGMLFRVCGRVPPLRPCSLKVGQVVAEISHAFITIITTSACVGNVEASFRTPSLRRDLHAGSSHEKGFEICSWHRVFL